MLIGAGLLPAAAFTATVPEGFADTTVARGFERPSAMTALPDGRLLVLQATGEVRLLKQDILQPTPIHSVANVDSTGERGCLGLAADPAFASNGHVYLYCTVNNGSDSNNRVLRLTVQDDTVIAETTILDLPPVPAGVRGRMGGGLRVGPDGKFYIGAGSQEDERPLAFASNSLNLSNPFGKILRINLDGSTPNDNPYVNTAGVDAKIYAYGLRNPYGINFSAEGQMLVSDMGAGSWEEINPGAARSNYGWSDVEGPSANPAHTNPLYAYEHRNNACAVTGTTFYNPGTHSFPPEYQDAYFYVDFCDGRIRMLPTNARTRPENFAAGLDSPIALAVSPDGSLYYLNRHDGQGEAGGSLGKISYLGSELSGGLGSNPLDHAGTVTSKSTGSGGGCAIGDGRRFDPIWVLLLLLGTGGIVRRRRKASRHP